MLEETVNLRAKVFSWLKSVGLVLLVGLLIVMGAAAWIPEEEYPFWHAVIRDIGIAFIVGPVVTVTFELYARARFQVDTIDQVFDTTMRAIWEPEVWKEVRVNVFEKKIIRENYDLHLTFEPVEAGRMLMEIRVSYDVRSLLYKTETVEISNTLDKHICDETRSLPCFVSVQIGNKPYDIKKGLHDDVVKVDAEKRLHIRLKDLPPHREDKPVTLEIVRKEFTYVPGTYSLTMPDITKVACVHLLNLPADIEASIFAPIHVEEPKVLQNNRPNRDIFRNKLLLPGQTIEFHFRKL